MILPARRVPLRILLAIFVLSGAAGLIYEVVWARQLVLVFGNTSQAVSTILTGFFGGLAIGGWYGGRLADRVARPLRLYGVLEMVLVVIVLLTPLSFRLIGELYRGLYPVLAEMPLALALVRFALAILALAPATVLMGATLPTLTRFLTRRGDRGLASSFQRLYVANTIGAIVGTFVAGMLLIELLGLTGALLTGALCSGTAGLVALGLDRWVGSGGQANVPEVPAEAAPEPVSDLASEPGVPASDPRAMRRLALSLAFASGLTSLGYQVVWNRLVGAGTGSSTYVFTTILTLFLIGISFGAAMAGPLRLRFKPTTRVIAGSQLATAVLVVFGAVLLSSPSAPFWGGGPIFFWALGYFALTTFFVVFPATVAMGITFPTTAALLSDAEGHAGASSGALLAVNTAGSLVATFALPFFVIPLIGSPATLAALAIVNALIGTWLFVRERRTSRSAARIVGSLAGVAVAVLVVAVAATGTAFVNPTLKALQGSGAVIHETAEDEIASTVVATRADGMTSIWVAGTSMTIITVDTKFMPLIPLALRPEAKRGLTIAFGMGTAFRTALKAGVQTDAVELVPSVPGMLPWFYADGEQVLADPNGEVIIADGRNHVELTDRLYDFIVVDPPPPPESSGVSVISTLEFYQAAKKRLTPDGVMVQWVPYGQTQDEFLAHVRSFLDVFGNVNVIAGPGRYGMYMIGSDGPVDLEPADLEAVLNRPGILDDVNSAPDAKGQSASGWAVIFDNNVWASGDELRALVGDGPRITDDRPLPEYFILRRIADPFAKGMSLKNLRQLQAGE